MKHGKTTLPDSFRPRVPVAGNLKIGGVEARGEGKSSPKKLDHFRFCTPSATADGVYGDHEAFVAENKAKVREYTIELISDDPSVNLDVSYAMATRGAIVCRGDGVNAERRSDARGSLSPDAPFKPLAAGICGENCPFARSKSCKLASTLRFRIPGRTPLGHVWQFRSTSWNTAVDLLGAMEEVKRLTGGTLARIPIRISMLHQKRTALVEGKGRQGSTFWTVALAFAGTTEEELLDSLEAARKLKDRYATLGVTSLEETLRAEGSPLVAMDPLEEAAFAREFFPGQDAPAAEVPTPTVPAPTPQEEPEKAAATPAPAGAPKAGPAASSAQINLIRNRVAGHAITPEALEAFLAGLSKSQASDFIGQMLNNPKAALAQIAGSPAA